MSSRSATNRLWSWIRAHPRTTLAVYLLLLVCSNIAQALVPRETEMLPTETRVEVRTHACSRDGAITQPDQAESVTISAIPFGPADTDTLPVLLLHGSPGQASNFSALGPELASRDRRTFALDMPGFGLSTGWVPDYSARAYARYTLAFMDEMGIERAHIVGWSNGGAVALNACDIAPDRVASITLLAAIACQETEGSGDFYFEHAKYAVGYAAVVVLPELVPHFGLLFPREYRHAFIRNFWDTDQRPIRAIMESLETPTLILHGRHDPLVSDRAAERHHELIPTSRLVMTAHSHFLPFMQPALTATYLEEHFARHDTPGVAPRTDELILEPPAGSPWFRSMLARVRALPWPAIAAACALLAWLRRESATAIAGLFVGHGVIDFGVAFLGLLIGRLSHQREPAAPDATTRTPVRTFASKLLWTAISLLIAQIALGSATGIGDAHPIAVLAAVLGVAAALHLVKRVPTRRGRREMVVFVRRFAHHEWWPSWAMYALLAPRFVRLALRHRSLTVWTCVNPGIEPGGGIVGEPKDAILSGIDPACALTQFVVAPADRFGSDHAERARYAHEIVAGEVGIGYPVVVKPEAGERGAGVTVVRTERELIAALASIPAAAIVQRYHPGPIEVGVFWVRNPATVGNERTDATQGRVFAVTRKVFPELVCDGERTIGEQILAHRRYRMQAHVYRANLRDRLGEVPPAGARVRLTEIGNHAKGCRFEDGSDLITPAFSEAVDRIARTWRGAAGEPFDYGRMDVRCVSEESLRAGEGLAVIELNGVTSEATNLYDPSWSAARALRLLGAQWAVAFELGTARRAVGGKPLGIGGIVRAVRDARRVG